MNSQFLRLSQRSLGSWKHVETQLNRSFASSCRRSILVGPPDSISNIRPVIYDDVDGTAAQANRPRRSRRKGASNDSEVGAGDAMASSSYAQNSPTHPYLLDEFSGDPSNYQWRVEQSKLDAYNHEFWKDSNTRFEEAKRSVLDAVPESASPETREAALTEFYTKWYAQEQIQLRDYSRDWNRRNFGGILLAARIAIRQCKSRFFGGPR